MEATVLNQPLNDTQMFVLQTFAVTRNEQEREELTSFYLDYIQRKLDVATDKWWKDNEMNNDKLNEILNTHYKRKI